MVKTSNVAHAGTNANAFMQVYGSKGKSDIVQLQPTKKSAGFERNHEDAFDLELPELGSLTKLRVWHDNR